jgi:hypothetical protein
VPAVPSSHTGLTTPASAVRVNSNVRPQEPPPRPPMNTIPALAALLLACTTSLAAPPEGEDLLKAIQGNWCRSPDEGKTCEGVDRISSTNVSACGRFPDGTTFTSQAEIKVQGRRVCLRVTQSSRSDIPQPGYTFCVDVLEINSKWQRYRSTRGGREHVLYRASEQNAKCPAAQR